ncbi:serine palmitoyltransferase, partial [Phakopsora pachyrhizi]
LWSSKFNSKSKANLCPDDGNYRTYLTTYFSYLLLFLIGHVRDAIGKRLFPKDYEQLMPHNGYAALNSDFGSFFTRRVKSKLDDCFSRPVTGPPGRTIKLLDRTSLDYCFNFKFTHTITQALNIASYNYLGFAQSRGRCAHAVERDILKSGVFSGGSGATVGLMTQHVKAEKLLASFLGVQDSIIISQGFATNSTTLPALVGPGCLIISDELNHASIRFGARLSGAMVRTYKHNNMRDLERVLRNSISHGQTRKLRGWKKIIVAVEGLYSMEGSIVDLPGLLRLREKFKFYLYLDEAHSIGALGPNGRGVCDYYGVDPNRVDILMGTLTKSFGASGGYIAGSKLLIDHLRRKSHSSVYAESLSPAVLTQITTSMKLIAGKDLDDQSNASNNAENNKDHRSLGEGQIRLKRLAFNSRYLHAGLKKLGFIVPGDMDSPIVPLLVFQPGKLLLFSRLMLQRYSIVVVVVGYPATPIVSGRVRFCVSACHTKEDIDKVLIATDEIGEMLGLKLAKYSSGNQSSKSTRKGKGCFTFWKIEEVISRARELVYDYQID